MKEFLSTYAKVWSFGIHSCFFVGGGFVFLFFFFLVAYMYLCVTGLLFCFSNCFPLLNPGKMIFRRIWLGITSWGYGPLFNCIYTVSKRCKILHSLLPLLACELLLKKFMSWWNLCSEEGIVSGNMGVLN